MFPVTDLVDLDHVYGEDLGVTATGDIAVVSKHDRTFQRILRRLMTVATSAFNGSAYPWQPKYGVGLGARIGETLRIRAVRAAVRSQMLLEPTVLKVPAPVINVTPLGVTGATIDILYTDISGIPQSFSFDIGSPQTPPPHP